jgi:hypothetical protein
LGCAVGKPQFVYCEQTVALFYDAATENLPPAFGVDDGSIRALIQAVDQLG